jgi:hypothetical protein
MLLNESSSMRASRARWVGQNIEEGRRLAPQSPPPRGGSLLCFVLPHPITPGPAPPGGAAARGGGAAGRQGTAFGMERPADRPERKQRRPRAGGGDHRAGRAACGGGAAGRQRAGRCGDGRTRGGGTPSRGDPGVARNMGRGGRGGANVPSSLGSPTFSILSSNSSDVPSQHRTSTGANPVQTSLSAETQRRRRNGGATPAGRMDAGGNFELIS